MPTLVSFASSNQNGFYTTTGSYTVSVHQLDSLLKVYKGYQCPNYHFNLAASNGKNEVCNANNIDMEACISKAKAAMLPSTSVNFKFVCSSHSPLGDQQTLYYSQSSNTAAGAGTFKISASCPTSLVMKNGIASAKMVCIKKVKDLELLKENAASLMGGGAPIDIDCSNPLIIIKPSDSQEPAICDSRNVDLSDCITQAQNALHPFANVNFTFEC